MKCDSQEGYGASCFPGVSQKIRMIEIYLSGFVIFTRLTINNM